LIANPDNRVLAALAALEGNHDFEVVKEWLLAGDAKLDKDSLTIQEIQLYRNQGARLTLKALFDACKNAVTRPRP
jgi:hypothetical protein